MASIYRSRTPHGDRWTVRWNSLRGYRAKKVFRTEGDAEAYLPLVDERPKKKSGPKGRDGSSNATLQDRIKNSIETDPHGCWIWQLRCMPTEGYGLIAVNSHPRMAHRVSYETFVGPIPEGLQLDHLCRVRACVNPEHLEPVTARENVLRSPIAQAALNAAKTHCPWEHEYTPENTYLYGPHGRWRLCKACARSRSRKAYAARKGEK